MNGSSNELLNATSTPLDSSGGIDGGWHDEPTIDAPQPGDVLRDLGVTAHELAAAYLLGRDPHLCALLSDRLEVVGGPHQWLTSPLRGGDLLVRTSIGEGHAMAAVLVDGRLLDRDDAQDRGWRLDGTLPGRYARVQGGGPFTVLQEPPARRITDQNDVVAPCQLLLRIKDGAAQRNAPHRTDVAAIGDLGEAVTPAVSSLTSARLAGDGDLDAVARGQLRLAAPGTPPWPAPVRSSGSAITRLQQALIDLGYPLPQYGADGSFGTETGRAVARFKSDTGIAPADPVVGRATITALDAALVGRRTPDPEPSPAPSPLPNPPRPVRALGLGDHVWYYGGQLSTALDIPRESWFPGSRNPTDYQGRGGEIYQYVIHADGEIRCGQPHMNGRPGSFAWLNNNPGNLTGPAGGRDWGQYRDKFNWNHFLIFPTFQHGFDAIARFLREGHYPANTVGPRTWPAGKYRDLGITEAFHHYAPAGHGANDPDRYGAEVAAAAGVPATTLISALDDDQMRKMQDKIFQIEGTRPGTVLTRDHPELPDQVRAALA